MSGCDDQSDHIMYVVFLGSSFSHSLTPEDALYRISNAQTRMSRKHSTHASHSNTGTESSLLRSNLTSRLSRARKLFEINLEQTDIPKRMYKKLTERSTKHSEEAMYNLLFTGIEVLFSNEKQNESVRARVRGV